MSPLFQEVNRWAGLQFVWGETDCMLVLADWIERVTGVDVAANVRGTYYDAGTAQAVVGWIRDPINAVARVVEPHLSRTDSPTPGDIGVIEHYMPDGSRRKAGALFLGRSWASIAQQGVTELSRPLVIAAWHVPYEPPHA